MDENPTPDDLTKPLIDAAMLFDSLGIGYALIGGLAAMVYGRARFTRDVDFVASTGHERRLDENPDAMRRHGFDPARTWKLYHRSGAQVDLWKDGFADQIIARAQAVRLAGHTVKVAEPHDLIAMKLRADRPQDDYDISEVLKNAPIEDDAVREKVDPEQFGRYLAIKKRIGLSGE